MKYAKFFILSSRYEGFANVLLEALACGTPVIATDCETGTSEIIENGENGILVPVADEEALKEAMEKLFNDKGLYNKLKANSSRSVERFDIETIIKDWKNLFEKEYCL